MKENVGCQDQITTAHGGFNLIKFNEDGSTNISPVITKQNRLKTFQESLMLFFTGISRHASEIAGEQIKNIDKHTSELKQIYEMVEESIKIMDSSGNQIEEFGKLLHESWLLKQTLAKTITNNKINEIYESGRKAGAIGGKILGAGGGGFILFVAPKNKQREIKKALANLVYDNFRFDNDGSKVIVFDPID